MKKILLLFVIIFSGYNLIAQPAMFNDNGYFSSSEDSLDSKQSSYFYEPYPQIKGATILQLGGSFTLLPITVVENEYPIPAIDLQFKYGVLKNFSLVSSFSTNYFSNLLHTGIQWNINKSNFSFGIANHIGGFAGFMTSEGQFENN